MQQLAPYEVKELLVQVLQDDDTRQVDVNVSLHHPFVLCIHTVIM